MKKIAIFVLTNLFIISQLTYALQLSHTGSSPNSRAPQTRAKDNFLKDVNILFLKEDYAALVKNAESGLKRYRFTRIEKKEVLYLIGLSYVKTGDFDKARKAFNDILEMKGGEFREDAYIGIADSYFYESKFDEANKAYENVLNMYPRSERTSSIYYNLGLSYKEKKDFHKANAYFQKIKKYYDTSFEADKAVYLPTEVKTTYYIIQLGAFRSLRNAKKLVRKLSRKKYKSYIQKIKKGGDILYRVRGGKFSNKYYAMRLLRRLRRSGFAAKLILE